MKGLLRNLVKWSTQENDLVLEGIQKYGKDYYKIYLHTGGSKSLL